MLYRQYGWCTKERNVLCIITNLANLHSEVPRSEVKSSMQASALQQVVLVSTRKPKEVGQSVATDQSHSNSCNPQNFINCCHLHPQERQQTTKMRSTKNHQSAPFYSFTFPLFVPWHTPILSIFPPLFQRGSLLGLPRLHRPASRPPPVCSLWTLRFSSFRPRESRSCLAQW